MTTRSIELLRRAVTPLLTALASLKDIPGEGQWVFKRDGSGRVETKLSWLTLVQQHQKTVDVLEPTIVQWISTYYPSHSGRVGTMMGFGPIQPHAVLWTIASELYKRHGRFQVKEEQIDNVLADVIEFFESDSYHFDVFAVALNLQGDANLPPIPFPGNFALRPITDDELTRFYGGNPFFNHHSMPTVSPQFVFVTELSLPKKFGVSDDAPPPSDALFENLDRGMLALATFKEAGAVGYEGIRFEPRGVAVGAATKMTYRKQEIPPSPFRLEVHDVAPLTEHIKRFSGMHSSLEIACQRLVDAGRRTKPRDAIMDAVIGMESILLTGLQGELSFRFALNYSMLVPDDRRTAYKTARDLYKWRSKIAHGSSVSDTVAFAGQNMNLHEVAKIAKNTLRFAISKFIEDSNRPPYLAPLYWDDLHTR